MKIARTFHSIVFAFINFLCHATVTVVLPAFPGAEGFGSDTVESRGGKVLHVTTLFDNGDNNNPTAGSFRAAIRSSGPKVVVFDVSGTTYLQSQLNIEEPFITIARQTSPGGIATAGHSMAI